ncbi:MAG: cation diffusion facilitator family transporter [Proteobacteria bacterium]|nr:cation diffusion facilitator family transporter [Pseudomonadota bacterium]
MEIKQRASLTAIISAFFLALGKFIIGLYSGSMAVITSALDSFLDIFMSTINYLAIRKAEMPPDKNHLYGHGKVEDLASIVQSLFILFTGSFIIFKSFEKIFKGADVFYTKWDITIMILSIFVSFFISRYLNKVGEATNSNALKADALHYSSDLYSNTGVLIAILLSQITGRTFFDFLLAIIIGIVIIFSAFGILKQGVYNLSDISLSKDMERDIDKIIEEMPMPYAGYHKLRTRTSGSRKFIDFHLLVCRKASIEEAHEMADSIEEKISNRFGNMDIIIHIEPCPYDCDFTEENCRVLKMRKVINEKK